MLIDTHAHLNHKDFKFTYKDVVRDMKKDNISHLIVPSFNLESSERALELAGMYPNIYAALGIHPHDASFFDENAAKFLRENAGNPRVVAIGEIGLDYYRNLSPKNSQIHAFLKQLEIAKQAGLPVVFHVRDAYDDFFTLLKENLHYLTKGVMHCFSGTAEIMKKALDLGLFISFTGNITYNSEIASAASKVPLNRVMLETDCPYLAPLPDRGKQCYPRHVNAAAKKLAELLKTDVCAIEQATTDNAFMFFDRIKE